MPTHRQWVELPASEKDRFFTQAQYLIEKGFITTTKTVEEVAMSIFAKTGPKEERVEYNPYKDFPLPEE